MWYVIVFVVGVLCGALGGYLALRNNPEIKRMVDSKANQIDPN